MKYQNIILDGPNLFWRCWFNNTSECILGDNNVYSGGIAEFIDRIKKLRKQFGNNDTKFFILFDNPESTVKMRKEIDETYKSHRLNNKYSNEINKSIQYLKEILRSYFDNTYMATIENYEADDIVKPLLEKIEEGSGGNILLLSADLDWSRSIFEGDTYSVHWFNFKKLYTAEEFKKEYGFFSGGNRIKLYKAFKGDASDCIPNAVPYLPKDILLHILETYNELSMNNLFPALMLDKYITSKWKIKIKDSENRIKKNYTLVDFIKIEENLDDYIQECKRNKTLARVWYKIIGLDIDSWMLDKENPVDFLQVKTFRKNIKRK